MPYEFQKSPNYRFQYNKLNTRMQRFVDEALGIIQETPREFQGKITFLSHKKEFDLYRFRIPGAYLLYLVPQDAMNPQIILTSVRTLH